MTQLKVTQVRSTIDRPKDQKDTVRRLGLRRMHHTVIKDDRPEIRGMIAKVRHLVRVEEIGGEPTKGRSTRKDEA
ncbi:MAG: 50S ribosomal protein L30 [Actinomycetota bacterium]